MPEAWGDDTRYEVVFTVGSTGDQRSEVIRQAEALGVTDVRRLYPGESETMLASVFVLSLPADSVAAAHSVLLFDRADVVESVGPAPDRRQRAGATVLGNVAAKAGRGIAVEIELPMPLEFGLLTDDSRARAIFERNAAPIAKTIADMGGAVSRRKWVNSRLYATIPATEENVRRLAELDQVRFIDSPTLSAFERSL